MPLIFFCLEMILIIVLWYAAIQVGELIGIEKGYQLLAVVLAILNIMSRYGRLKSVLYRQDFHCGKYKKET